MPTKIGPITPNPPAAPVIPPAAPKAPVMAPAAPVMAPAAPKTPTAPSAPKAPVMAPAAPKTPTAPSAPKAPVIAPAAPKAPTAPVMAPAAPKAPVMAPTAPKTPTAPPSNVWWSGCVADYWEGSTQKLRPCAWEPWLDDEPVPDTWCCPNPANKYDYSWPVYNLGQSACPNGQAKAFALTEEDASVMTDLPMGAWIGIACGIAVVIIIIIVVVIIVKKKKNDERV